MKIGLKLSFTKDSLNGKFYIQLFDEYIKFQPYSFTKENTTKKWNERKHKKVIMNADNNDNLIIDSHDSDIYITTDTGTKKPHRTVGIVQDKHMFLPSNDQVEQIINKEGFIVAYLYDNDYADVQSTSFSNNYSYKKYPSHILDSIKNTPYKINEFGNREYEIKNNAGKVDLIGFCWLMASYKMWFGEPFFQIVPKEKILSFPDAYEIKEFEDGKIFVQLFEKLEESSSIINMEKQRKWRQWLDFEKLLEMYK